METIEHEDIPPDAKGVANKGDFSALRREIAAKFATKDELAAMEQRILDHFDAAVENISQELRGANADEISLLKDTDNKLHDRIVPLERQVGIESPSLPHPLPEP
jgi:hypothetical protein